MKTNINSKLKLALIKQISAKYPNNQGFVLPMVIGLGLLLILVGITMIVRSSDDQINAISQKSTARGLSAAEAGVAYYQNLINSARIISLYPDCRGTRNSSGVCPDSGTTTSWSNASAISGLSTCTAGIASTLSTEVSNNTSWKNIDSSDPSKGQFRLIRYSYTDFNGNLNPTTPTTDNSNAQKKSTGTLIVEGRENSSNMAAKTRLEVTIPIGYGGVEQISIPGAWFGTASNVALGNNRINGDTFFKCNTNLDNINTNNIVDPYEAKNVNIDFPDMPVIPSTGSPGFYNLGTSLAAITGKNNAPNCASGQSCLNYEFPRLSPKYNPPDTPDSNGVYHYRVGDIILNNTTVNIIPGQKVRFYVTGDIDAEIKHTCGTVSGCKPTNFQIFGYGTKVGSTKEICLNGNDKLEGFIFAKDYTGGVAGGANGKGGFKGTIWVNNWSTSGGCGSSTNAVVIDQTASWDDLGQGLVPKGLPPKVDPAQTWQRREIQ